MGLTDEALSLEERLDHELLSKSVKTLLRRLSDGSDKEVLTRFYLREEPRDKICSALALTSYQFNESLVRARRRFAEILRREGVALADVDVSCRRSTQKAARYVADELGLLKKAEFEIHMIQNNCCNREVDVWSTIKRYMPGSRGRKRVIG
jgi:K+-sensing histidine kinase KdpD